MKNKIIIGLLAVFGTFATACFTPQDISDNSQTENTRRTAMANDTTYVNTIPTTLADILIRSPKVVESYYGNEFTVRGGLPLYIVDGVPVGNNYASAANAVNVQNISSVEVLTNPSDLIQFGRRANHGVILIKTFGS